MSWRRSARSRHGGGVSFSYRSGGGHYSFLEGVRGCTGVGKSWAGKGRGAKLFIFVVAGCTLSDTVSRA